MARRGTNRDGGLAWRPCAAHMGQPGKKEEKYTRRPGSEAGLAVFSSDCLGSDSPPPRGRPGVPGPSTRAREDELAVGSDWASKNLDAVCLHMCGAC